MKKITLFLIMLLAGSFAANAQNTIIPKLGLTISSVAVDGSNPDSKAGLVVGAGLDIPVADIFSVQPELLFIQKGFEGFDPVHYNYLEIPVLGKVNFGTDQIKAFANIGPSFGFLVGVSSDGDRIDLDDSDNRLDVGLQLGGGVGIPAGPGTVQVELRYGLGLTNIEEDVDSQNRVFAIMFGYAIPFGN